jgi:hypothetical protein
MKIDNLRQYPVMHYSMCACNNKAYYTEGGCMPYYMHGCKTAAQNSKNDARLGSGFLRCWTTTYSSHQIKSMLNVESSSDKFQTTAICLPKLLMHKRFRACITKGLSQTTNQQNKLLPQMRRY